jgi:hypothetical protein
METKRPRRAESNAAYYRLRKGEQDHVLMRFDRGGAAALDEAAGELGLSRSACCRMLLPALLASVSPRLAAIEAARGASGQSLTRFIGAALDEALEEAAQSRGAPAPTAAEEFDALFGGGS